MKETIPICPQTKDGPRVQTRYKKEAALTLSKVGLCFKAEIVHGAKAQMTG